MNVSNTQALWSDPVRRALRWSTVVASTVVSAVVLVAVGATVLGQDVFVITGGSMSPAVPAGSLVVAERVHVDSLRPGDIITFRRASAPDSPVTHRVTSVEQTPAGIEVWTKGDANLTVDPEPIVGDHLVSRTRITLPMAGYIMAFLRTPAGQFTLIGLPLLYLSVRTVLGMRGRGNVAERSTVASTARVRVLQPKLGSFLKRPETGSLMSPMRTFMRSLSATTARLPRPSWPGARGTVEAPGTGPLSPPRLERIDTLFGPVQPVATPISESVQPSLDAVLAVAHDLESRARDFELAMDRSLAPLTDYADRLEESLARLESRLETSDAGLRRVFDAQISTERARLQSVREAIEDAKQPLRALLAREAQALDAIMAPFDDELASVERLQREQRRHLVRVAAGLDSDEFRSAVGLVRERLHQLKVLAEMGETDPGEVQSTLAADGAAVAHGNAYVLSALAVLEARRGSDPSAEVSLPSVA